MTYAQRMRRVVLPQAIRVIIPPTGNEFIAMMKDTALVGFLGASVASAELFLRAQLAFSSSIRNRLESLLVAAAPVLAAHVGVHVLPGSAGEADLEGVRPHRGEGGRGRQAHAVPSRCGGRRRAAIAPRCRSHAGGGAAVTTDAVVKVENLHKYFGSARGAEGHRHGGEPRRGRRDLRAIRLGEVHAPSLRQLPRGPDLRHHRGGRDPARGRAPYPSQSASRSASSVCTPGWCSSRSTCSRR